MGGLQAVVHLLGEEDGGSSSHDIPESIHDGYVTFSEVEGMAAVDDQALKEIGLTINGSGPWWVLLALWRTVVAFRDKVWGVWGSGQTAPVAHVRGTDVNSFVALVYLLDSWSCLRNT